jgi:hypothetical protein
MASSWKTGGGGPEMAVEVTEQSWAPGDPRRNQPLGNHDVVSLAQDAQPVGDGLGP